MEAAWEQNLISCDWGLIVSCSNQCVYGALYEYPNQLKTLKAYAQFAHDIHVVFVAILACIWTLCSANLILFGGCYVLCSSND